MELRFNQGLSYTIIPAMDCTEKNKEKLRSSPRLRLKYLAAAAANKGRRKVSFKPGTSFKTRGKAVRSCLKKEHPTTKRNISRKRMKLNYRRRRIARLKEESSSEESSEDTSSEDEDEEGTPSIDLISAVEMRKHMLMLKSQKPDAPLVLVILRVLPDGSMQAIEHDSGNILCSVSDSKINSKEQQQLDRRRRAVIDKWKNSKIGEHPLMMDKLPAGVPKVRFPGAECKIEVELEGKEIPASKHIHLSVDQLAELRKQMEWYLSRGFWRPSSSPYAAPILFSPKYSSDGKFDGWRLCTDYRKLNKVTKLDKFPLPTADELISQL